MDVYFEYLRCYSLPLILFICGFTLLFASLYTYYNRDAVVGPEERYVELEVKWLKYRGAIEFLLILIGLALILASFYFALWNDCRKVMVSDASPNTNAQPTNPNPTPNIQITIIEIQACFEQICNKPRYTVRPVPSDEVVKDKRGDYYYIDLKDADNNLLVLFKEGEYRKDLFEREFFNSMSAFKADVLSQLREGKVDYELFVRGSADILGNDSPSLGQLIEGESINVTYLLRNPQDPDQYIQQSKTDTIFKNFRNKDLPNLRAKHIQLRLAALDLTATLLDGQVTKDVSEEDRNALILLYWPKRGDK
ncbi:MAG: hypothetical protein QOH49_3390 [Acidobacteriota bacterium]|jgi:hypothetical protein|nr:hypothetical protein [Acidobacteriota bacterium]